LPDLVFYGNEFSYWLFLYDEKEPGIDGITGFIFMILTGVSDPIYARVFLCE